MNGNFLLYMYYLWHCVIYVNIQGEREKERAVRRSEMHDRSEKRTNVHLNYFLYGSVRQLNHRYFQIKRMEERMYNSYRKGKIDTLEMKSRRVLLERARKKCHELENYLEHIQVAR